MEVIGIVDYNAHASAVATLRADQLVTDRATRLGHAARATRWPAGEPNSWDRGRVFSGLRFQFWL